MKNCILFISLMFFFGALEAQGMYGPQQAVGIRVGGSDGAGAEVSFQTFVGGESRIEGDLGFFDEGWKDGFKVTLLYQWVTHISGGFSWYSGIGGSIGGWEVDEFSPHGDEETVDGFFLDIDGDLGLEYYFPIPLQMSLDLRPEIGVVNDDFDMGFGLGIRYSF